MEENERRTLILDSIWWWLPARWEHDGAIYEVRNTVLVENDGVNVLMTKDEGDEVSVFFSDAECIGDLKLQPDDARTRIYAEVL
jgi:hypothetical protein